MDNPPGIILDSSLNGTATVSDFTMDNTYDESGTVVGHVHPMSKRSGMSVLEMIHHAGPDFMSNKFDIYFLWDPLEADTDTNNLEDLSEQMVLGNTTPIEKFFLNHRGFAVRAGKVEVPPVINQDYSMPFLETQINKVKSNKTNNNEATISLRMDQDLIWLNEMQLLSGRLMTLDNSIIDSNSNNDFINIGKKNGSVDRPISLRRNWQYLFKCIAKTWPTRSRGDSYKLKQTGLCIIVKMEHLGTILNLYYQQKILPYFVFENVKILGTSDKIGYSRDSADPQDVSMKFIFKRSYELMPTINVRHNNSNRSWERVTNRDTTSDDLFPKGYKIPIYDDEESYGELALTPQQMYFTLNR